MSPWEQLNHYLSGTMAFGFLFYVFATLLVWGAWTFVYFSSKDLTRKNYIRWGFLLTLSIWMMYGVQRYNHPPLLNPERLWVQPFTAPAGQEDKADLARFSFEKAMQRLGKNVVGFQTRHCGDKLLLRLPPDADAPVPKGAKLVGAAWSVTGAFEQTGAEIHLQLHANRLNWTGDVQDSYGLQLKGSDPAALGILAAQNLVEQTGATPWEEGRLAEFTPEVMEVLCVNDTASDNTMRQAALLTLADDDTSHWMVWQALADLYFFWDWPDYNGQARSALQQALRFNREAPRANYISGLMLWREGGHREEAISGFRQAQKFDPRDPDPYLALSRLDDVELRALRLGSLKDILEFALSLRPSSPQARSVLYRYYRDSRMEKEIALQVVNRGLELNPNQPRLLMMQAVAAIKLQKNEVAEEALTTILANDSTNAAALYNLGIVYRAQGRDEEAVEAFKQVLEMNGPPDAHYYLGLYYANIGDREEAIRQFQWRWVKQNDTEDDWFAAASRERIRMLRTGKSPTGKELQGWEVAPEDTTRKSPEMIDEPAEER